MSQLYSASATREITPDPDDVVPMAGYGDPMERPATAVHDTLTATAMVLSDGGTTIGILSADLIGVPRELGERVRKVLAAEGVQLDHLAVIATHTHGGPALPMVSRRSLDVDLSRTVDRIERGFVESVTDAYERRESATIRIGRATNDVTAENRRLAGGVNGGVRVPTGEIDPEVIVIDVETATGGETVLYNYACHPVCTVGGETRLTADWPGHVARRIEEETGATTMFLNGAAADINPRDRYADDRAGDAVYEYMADIGDEMTEAVREARAVARDGHELESVPVAGTHEEVSLELKAVPDRQILERRAEELDEEITRLEAAGERRSFDVHYNRMNSLVGRLSGDRYWVRTMLKIADLGYSSIPATIQSLVIGPIGVLTMPGEVFVRHGLDFKAAAAAETLVPVGYANGYLGYIPTLDDLANGGYEVNSCRLSPGGIRRFRETALELVSP